MISLLVSVRLALVTLLVCAVGYTSVVLGFAKIFAPETAEGSLIRAADGRVLGSRLVAQKFTRPAYFWPRPSAVDYNAAGAGGSNKSPTNPELTTRAKNTLAEFGADGKKPLPADLVAASGSGLDPHLSERAALYQAERVAHARNLPRERVTALIAEHAFAPGGVFTRERLVNVLELNLALDGLR